ncbi:sulfate transporter [Fusarium sporotrichioides]|uniref:Sulfate transporter n=1 Tax=Fusarium sporotrichioides TaxID=5514 RepID=A0A395RVU2_FUSSP|nr:sulfate transporter [Fusarium sporotrichioides]
MSNYQDSSHRPAPSQSTGYGSITTEQLPTHTQRVLVHDDSTASSTTTISSTDIESQDLAYVYERTRYSLPYFRDSAVSTLQTYMQDYHKGDLIAALTVASLYIPLSFSFASLAHVSPASSLYAFVFHPIFWALLGSAPLMVVGPEATGSLLVGATVRYSKVQGQQNGFYMTGSVESLICGAVTALAGLILTTAGILRLGFLDNILSRPFMHGFISGIGFVLITEQTLVGVGVERLVKASEVADESSVMKIIFLLHHLTEVHLASALIATSTLAFNLVISAAKRRHGKSNAALFTFPDRLLSIVVAAFITYAFRLDKQGLAIVSAVDDSQLGFPTAHVPLSFTSISHLKDMTSTSILVALLGFFESSVAAKSLRSPEPLPQLGHSPLNVDRDLVALGVSNLVGGFFSTLPAFGGFGRSKLNAQAGGLTRMTSIFLAVVSLVCAMYATPWLYYVPRPCLAAMSIAVGISMLEESYPELLSIITYKAWKELLLMAAVFLAIILHSMGLGIVLGFGWTIITLIQDSTISHNLMKWESSELPDNHHRCFPQSGKCLYLVIEPMA